MGGPIPAAFADDADATRRARVLIGATRLLAIGLAVGMTVRVVSLGGVNATFPVNAVLLAVLVATPWLLRWTSSLRITTAIVATVTCADAMIVALQNAGLDTPIVLALMLLPVLVMFVAGGRAALIVTALACAEIAVLLGLQSGGHAFPTPAVVLLPTRATAMIIVTLILFGMAWLFEKRRRQAQDALRERDERYALAAEGSSDGIFDWPLDGRDAFYTQQLHKMLGYADGTQLTTSPLAADRVHPEDRDRVADALAAQFGQHESLDVDCRLALANGTYRWFQVRGGAVRDALGAPTRLVGTIRDIEARKATEALKRAFISTVNHELRTPLAAIHGALGLIHGGQVGPLTDETRTLVDIATRNSTRLLELVDDLLTLQRVDAGVFSVDAVDVDLSDCVREAVDSARAAAADTTIHLRTVPAPVTADPRRIVQVLNNLLTNAVRFGRAAPIEVAVAKDNGRYRVSVTDQGPGVPPELRPRVFDRFAQGDASASRPHGGSGIGLSVARALVEAMDGRIGLSCPDAGGAAFWFELPARPAVTDEPPRRAQG